MFSYRRLLIVLLGIVTAISTAQAQEKIALRLNLEPGQHFSQRMKMDQEIEQEMGGVAMTMNQETTTDYNYNVTAVDPEGVATIEATYTRLATKTSSGNSEMSYDSATAQEPIAPQFRPMAALVGQKFTMEVGPTGSVRSVTGLSELLEKVLGEIPAEGPAREQLKQSLKARFGEDSMKNILEQAMAIYPDHPVAVGDHWSRTVQMVQMVPLKLENTWTLKSVTGDTATLEMTSLVSPVEGQSTMDMMGSKIETKLEGAQSGTTVVDRKTGWALTSTVHQNIDGTMKLPADAAQPKELSVPLSIKSTITLGPVE